jgi:hypothetical protein
MRDYTPMADRESDGIILPDSYWGKRLGFTSKRWDENSWLWKDGEYIIISMVIAKEPGKGHFGSLCRRILQLGYGIRVPTAFPRMEAIVKRHGFQPAKVEDPIMGMVELWEKGPGETWARS